MYTSINILCVYDTLPYLQGSADNREARLPPTDDYQQSIESIQWTAEITPTQARRKLEVAMYPFKEVNFNYISCML